MNNFEELFNRDVVESISNLVESKMKLLKQVKYFKEKDEKLSTIMEEFDRELPEELKNKFDDIIRLTYLIEEYYFTLAFLLGSKYGRETERLL